MFPNVETTITLKSLLDSGFDLGLKDYPIWNEDHREELNKKIINHYYLREIGQETPGLFKHYLNAKMNEIMPYYCELYKTTQYEYNPIYNVDYEVEDITTNEDTNKNISTGKGSSTTSSTSDLTGTNSSESNATNTSENNNTSNSNGKQATVNTPASQLNVQDIDSLTAASQLNYAKESGSENINASGTATNEETSTNTSTQTNEGTSSNELESTSESTASGTTIYKRKLQGNYGVKSTQAMIEEERKLILNIDMQIIAELTSCFMLVM